MDHAVIVTFPYGSTNLEELFALEDELIEAIEASGCGELDGNEVATDGSEAILFMYGPDADKLFGTIKAVFEASKFKSGAVAKLRYGPPEDGVREIEVTFAS
jgi:hypothetical protein